MKRSSTISFFVIIIFLVPVLVYAGYILYERHFQKLPVYGKTMVTNNQRVEHTIKDFQLIDQDGNPTGLAGWQNKIVVADFFFTNCPVVCPKMTKSLRTVQQSFGRDEIMITSFTVDPVRDDPQRLKWYAKKFGIDTRNWVLLTGDKKVIYTLARNSFMIVATDGDGGDNDFIHSEKLVLIDRHQRIRGYYDGMNPSEVRTLIGDIKKLKHEK